MPEVRKGSNLGAGSDAMLSPLATPPLATPPAATTTTPPVEGAAAAAAAEAQPNSSLNALARPTTLEQSHTLSGDSIPITKQISPLRRLSFALGRRGSAPLGSTGGPSTSTGSLTAVAERNRRATMDQPDASRKSISYALRPDADAYYDSRAAGHKEWTRRAKNLQEYYDENPDLLPQLPFTWHHGNRRWRLWFFAFVVIVDASAVPIALYYGMKYAGHVQEYIIFIIVTTIWGGPSYLEFAIRTLRLMKKERFYRPLGTDSRWCADMTTWAAALTIFVLTVLFIIGSAPRDTWLRVVAMAAVSILWCLGGVLLAIQLLHAYNIPAPFRISSTGKGEPVHAGAYYFIEDILAVNAGCGRPYREALAARYKASPRFREMLNQQSWFWSVPSLIMATILTIVAIIPQVPENWSYGVCWVAPFIWAFIWGCFTILMCKKAMVRERLEWEAGKVPEKMAPPSPSSEQPAVPPV